MCELFACSSSSPINVHFSLEEFSKHGGKTAGHKDGWGICYYDENDVRRFRGMHPAYCSEELNFLKKHNIISKTIISHIRKASVGNISLHNTQPFIRELRGDVFSFIHNGLVLSDFPKLTPLSHFTPIGKTDSEKVFCTLLNNLALQNQIDYQTIKGVFIDLVNQLKDDGPSNIILSNGTYIFAYSDVRKNKFDDLVPGLHYLVSKSLPEVDGLEINTFTEHDKILLASVPLSQDNWIELNPSTYFSACDGKIIEII
jgi:predicted glutamine amidotransferase